MIERRVNRGKTTLFIVRGPPLPPRHTHTLYKAAAVKNEGSSASFRQWYYLLMTIPAKTNTPAARRTITAQLTKDWLSERE